MKVQPVAIDIHSEGEGRSGGWEQVGVEIVAEWLSMTSQVYPTKAIY